MQSSLSRRAPRSLLRWLADRNSRHGEGVSEMRGHHNSNLVVPVRQPLAFLLDLPPGELGKFRFPLTVTEVVPRVWSTEGDVLRSVGEYVKDVPRCLADFGDFSVHSFERGVPLRDIAPNGHPVPEDLLERLASLFARQALVPAGILPSLPPDWPEDGDSEGFLRWLSAFTRERVQAANEDRFGTLFADLGIPRDAMTAFADRRAKTLGKRPFSLLHTDVHRANVVVREDRTLCLIDWELALWGDPTHDLATHLERMEYTPSDRGRMTELWRAAMTDAGYPSEALASDGDLEVYLDFERAQSVFPDVIRAAEGLGSRPSDHRLAAAVERTVAAVRRAGEPLELSHVPDPAQARAALLAWVAADGAGPPAHRSSAHRPPAH